MGFLSFVATVLLILVSTAVSFYCLVLGAIANLFGGGSVKVYVASYSLCALLWLLTWWVSPFSL